MKHNMGLEDRIFRIGVAIAVAVVYSMGYISGILAIVLGGLAIIFVLTSLIGTCPLYLPFGLSTVRKKLTLS